MSSSYLEAGVFHLRYKKKGHIIQSEFRAACLTLKYVLPVFVTLSQLEPFWQHGNCEVYKLPGQQEILSYINPLQMGSQQLVSQKATHWVNAIGSSLAMQQICGNLPCLTLLLRCNSSLLSWQSIVSDKHLQHFPNIIPQADHFIFTLRLSPGRLIVTDESKAEVSSWKRWSNVLPQTIQHFYDRIPRRIKAVVETKSGHTPL